MNREKEWKAGHIPSPLTPEMEIEYLKKLKEKSLKDEQKIKKEAEKEQKIQEEKLQQQIEQLKINQNKSSSKQLGLSMSNHLRQDTLSPEIRMKIERENELELLKKIWTLKIIFYIKSYDFYSLI